MATRKGGKAATTEDEQPQGQEVELKNMVNVDHRVYFPGTVTIRDERHADRVKAADAAARPPAFGTAPGTVEEIETGYEPEGGEGGEEGAGGEGAGEGEE
jgi:hypothetical protein